MTYAQILAGGVSFQLYNKSTNAVVPTSISDGGGYIEITEDATSDHNTIYKIDQFNGAVSEITLYTEGESAKTYALLGASQNEDVVAVRLFTQPTSWNGGEVNIVYAEINGKLYIPYVEDDQDWIRLNAVSPGIETVEDDNINGFSMLFPKTKVEIVESTIPGVYDSIKFLEFNDATANINRANEVVYKESYDGDEPWRFGQDGYFEGMYLSFVRINGINHAIVIDGTAASPEDPGIHPVGSEQNVYNTPGIKLECAWSAGSPIAQAKANETEEYGLEFGNDLEAVNGVLADVSGPFEP